MMKKIIMIIALATLIISCNKQNSNNDNQVRIVIPPTIISALPYWIAKENGYFKEFNITPKEYTFNDSQSMILALVNNDADVLPAVSLIDVINETYSRGNVKKPIIFTHSRMVDNPSFEALLVRYDSNIKTIKQLEGKKIAVYPGVTAGATLEYYLKNAGVDVSKITIIKLPPPEHVNLLKKGEIDCSYSYEPSKSFMLLEKIAKPLTGSIYATFNSPSAIGASAISSSFLSNKNELAERYFKLFNKSIDFIRNNNVEARKILAKYLKLPENIAMTATWVDLTKTNEFSRDQMLKTIESFQKIGLLNKDLKNMDEYFFKASQ